MQSIKLGSFAGKLMTGTALAMLAATAAQAQNESITVTGTSIRGQQPVGANVISVDRAAIESTGAQTTAQLLQTIPQLDNFGSAAQGGQNSADGTGTQAPTIHSLGNSASNATLVLIDGHRLPLTGLNHNLVDPSVIPTAAISNVEVLPDGASAIYGSDAVAGVINFHTRKDYNGWETSAQYGVADHYNTFNFSQLFGHSWDDGGVVAVYSYSNRSNLMNRDRDFITARQDLRLGAADPNLFTGVAAQIAGATGFQTTAPNGQAVPYPSLGGNFQNLTSCPVATISSTTANSGSVFAYPYTSPAIPRQTSLGSSGPSTGICDTLDISSALPSEMRNQALVSLHQAIGDKLNASFDVVYASRLGASRNARGGLTNAAAFNPAGTGDTAFGAANSAAALSHTNPFYVGVPGAAANANNEFISMGFDQLLAGQGLGFASTKTGQTTAFATLGLDYDVGGDWLLSLGGTSGTDFSFSRGTGSLNTAEALLALNGTLNTSGTTSSPLPDPYGLGSIVAVTRALTTANALDVWMPAATNRTSATVLRSLVDSSTNNTSVQNLQNVTLHADGPLFDLFGAGDVKAAFGGEWIHYTQDQRSSSANNTGPVSTSANTLNLSSKRTVYAAYAEFVVPVIGPDMNIPLVQKLTFDFAGRYDHYNDFGDTKNPKISFSWDIVDGLRTSASFGTSFTAPALDSIGQPGTGITGETGVGANNGGASNGLVVLFNDTRPFNNGAGIAGSFVANAVACKAAGSTPVDDAAGNINSAVGGGLYPTAIGCKNVVTNGSGSQGLTISGGNANLKPEIGQSYSANVALDFGRFVDALDGLTTQVTYYQAKFTGAITTLQVTTTQTVPGIPSLTTFGPANGCSAATIATCGAGLANEPGWAPSDPLIQSLLVGRPLGDPLPGRVYSLRDGTQQNAFNLWQNGIDFTVNYRIATDDMGNFNFGLSGNQILRATQKNGPSGVPFDALDGKNGGRYANVELTGRASIGWNMDPFTVGLSLSWQHPYNTGLSTFPYNLPGPNRTASYQHIGALQVFDLNLAYNLPDEWMSGTRVNLVVNNLLDTTPPFQNNTSGTANGSAVGRTVTLGVTKKW